MKTIIIIISVIIFAGCKKDLNSCKPKELSGQAQLIDAKAFGAAELVDTLAKYPQLQVYQLQHDGAGWIANCNIFYKGLIIFSSSYNLFKAPSGEISWAGDTIPSKTITVSLDPAVSSADAIKAAKQAVNFDHLCISYELGLFNTSYAPPTNYRLVWKIKESGHGYPFAIVDAVNKQILQSGSGIIYE